MTTKAENLIDKDHEHVIAYAYCAIQSILQSKPDITPEEFSEILAAQFPDLDAEIAAGYSPDEDEVVTVYTSGFIGRDMLYLHTEGGRLHLSDEFLCSLGGADENAVWEKWKFTTDSHTGKTVLCPAICRRRGKHIKKASPEDVVETRDRQDLSARESL